MKNQKGITLIALVITIIVMLVLAAVTISSIVGEDGITNRAQDAKDKTAIATEKEQINLAYAACKADNIETKEDGIKAPVEASELQTEMDRAYGAGAVTVSGSSSGLMVQYENSNRTYMIMQSGKTITDVSSAVQGGTNGPIGIAEDGTTVDLSIWSYIYDSSFEGYTLSTEISGYTPGYLGDIVNGRIEGKIPAYIMDNEVNGELTPVTALICTFADQPDLEYPPEIPSNVKYMNAAFSGCTNLKTVPKLSNNVISLENVFRDCQNITQTPVFPDSVTDMRYAFWGCTSLTKVEKLPRNLVDMSYCFRECTSLEVVPEIPENVEDMDQAFFHCTNLRTVQNIPSKVSNVDACFSGCSNLTGTIQVNNNIVNEYKIGLCFYDAATEPGCEVVLVGNGSNADYLNKLKETCSTTPNSNITIGN